MICAKVYNVQKHIREQCEIRIMTQKNLKHKNEKRKKKGRKKKIKKDRKIGLKGELLKKQDQ